MNRRRAAGLWLTTWLLLGTGVASAQVRGVYPLGMSSTGSGVLAEPGFTYSNQFLFYARDELKGKSGEVLNTGYNSVLMDMNTFLWASRTNLLLGARVAAAATLPIANNSLSSDTEGAMSGGGGFADSYYQPIILGWRLPEGDLKVAYGFLAPTGRFTAGANDNVGSGYWTHAFSSGQTAYVTRSRATILSIFEMYEIHTKQEGTRIQPGDTFDMDYSLTQMIPVNVDMRLQVGVNGYNQWQTTDTTDPSVPPGDTRAPHYRVHALGFVGNVLLPERNVTLGLKYFKEFEARSTLQGNSVQITGVIKF